MSDKTFFTRNLGPWMNNGFRPRGRFNAGAAAVNLTSPLALPPRKEGGYILQPVLHRLWLARKGAGLQLSGYCQTRLDGH